jgi:hypothetical protein
MFCVSRLGFGIKECVLSYRSSTKLGLSIAMLGTDNLWTYFDLCWESRTYEPILTYPPKDGRGFTISGNLKSFEGPVLKCRDSRKCRASYLNELYIHEIRNNASAIFQNFLFSCCKIEFDQLW